MTTEDRTLPEQIGRYQIVRPLGQGAMGQIFLAHDPVLDRPVAVKTLRGDLGLDSGQTSTLFDRMRQEARASARLSHPNIVALHDMGDDDLMGLFLVFEYVEGKNLKDELAQSGPFEPMAAATLAIGIGEALTTAHSAGVLHRDVKPENIIQSRTGAKIADFGIARVPNSTLTRDGGLLGTPAYSAPEAIAEGSFSPLSDQFSMAATLYEALSGRRAFPGDDAVQVASRIATDNPPPIADLYGLDRTVDTVLARGMSKVPRSRFDNCEDLGAALAEALRLGSATAEPRIQSLADIPRPAPPHRGGLARGALMLGAIGLAAAGAYQLVGRQPPPAVPVASNPVVELEDSSANPTRDGFESQPVAWLAERPRKARPIRTKRVTPSDAGASQSDARATPADAGASKQPAKTGKAAKGLPP